MVFLNDIYKRFYSCLLLFVFTPFIEPAFGKERQNHSTAYELVILSDTHLGAGTVMNPEPAGPDRQNDMDIDTFKRLMPLFNASLLSSKNAANHILVLGDLLDHYTSSLFGSIHARISLLSTHFATLSETESLVGLPMSYLPGNNDSLAGNYQPFYNSQISPHSAKQIAQNAGWKGYLSSKTNCYADNIELPCLLAEDKNGYYAEQLAPKLTLIALNTVLFSAENSCTDLCQEEIIWMKQRLQNAQNKGNSVIIAAHIPPGTDMHTDSPFWNDRAHQLFFAAVSPYAAQLFVFLAAHTHMEELRLIQFENNAPIPVIFTAGLSTSHGNLPSFKRLMFSFQEEKQQWKLADYETWHLRGNAFQPYYHAKAAYCRNSPEDTYLSECLASFVSTKRLNELLAIMNQYLTAGNPQYSMIRKLNAEKLLTRWEETV